MLVVVNSVHVILVALKLNNVIFSIPRLTPQRWFQCDQIKNLRQTFEGLFSNLATFEPTLAKFYGFVQILIVVHGKIKKDNLAILSHWLALTCI